MSLYMAINRSFVAFFLLRFFGGVRQPGWDVEGGAPQKKFGNRCSKETTDKFIFSILIVNVTLSTILVTIL